MSADRRQFEALSVLKDAIREDGFVDVDVVLFALEVLGVTPQQVEGLTGKPLNSGAAMDHGVGVVHPWAARWSTHNEVASISVCTHCRVVRYGFAPSKGERMRFLYLDRFGRYLAVPPECPKKT